MRIPLDLPVGLRSDDTTFSSAGRYADASNVRFRQGKPQIRGGCERIVTGTPLTGVCRTAFSWTDLSAVINAAFGTHSNLQVYLGGAVYDITPTKAIPPKALAANPFDTTNANNNVVVRHANHGMVAGDFVSFSGAAAVGGLTLAGGYVIVFVFDANSYQIYSPTLATSTATGGGSSVIASPSKAFAAGAIDGTGAAGYGTGAYSAGTFSTPSVSDYFPRTWSLAAWGQNLLACPRGGAIHSWTNATGTPAAPLQNSPYSVTHMLVAPTDQVFALGCNQEASGVFNHLCIRHSSIRNNTEWNTGTATTAREYILPGGGRIVGGRVLGKYLLVWTTFSLFLGTYVGSPNQVWRFDRVGDHCGLIGPNAAVIVGLRAFWIGPDLQFYSYGLGGQPETIDCPIRDDFAENMAPSQGDKIVASSTQSFQEIRFDYPDFRDGNENSRYLTLVVDGTDAGAWSRGVQARTAYVDAGPADYPIAADYSGNIYWQDKGGTDDGGPISWFIETADQYLSVAKTMMVTGLWPDTIGQVGPVTVYLKTRFKPQGDQTVYGPWSFASTDEKVDVRATGRLFRIRYEGASTPAECRFGVSVFDAQPTGGR